VADIIDTLKLQRRGRKVKIIPIDLLAYPNVRKKISASFNATTRDGYNEAHKTKATLGELGKYRPRHHAIEAEPPKAVILKEHDTTATQKIITKTLQQQHICKRVVHGLADPNPFIKRTNFESPK
jgi:hypothetical protein